jgi:hypothetical protein
MAEPTITTVKKPQKRVYGKPFEPGNNANPKGRPKGSKNKLSEDFVRALAKDFEEHGEQAICHVREEKPDAYLKVIASIIPKEFVFKEESNLDDLTDEQLENEIRSRVERVRSLLCGDAGEESTAKSNSFH